MVTPAAGIQLSLSNPSANDSVRVGSYQLQGIAFDQAAENATGVDRVSIFLGDRNQGGIFLGDASLLDSSSVHGLFRATVDIPNDVAGNTMFAYAHSSVSGHDTWMSVPIQVVR
jgi:hypothetical protein